MVSYHELALFINDEWLLAGGRETLPVIDPATGAEIGRLPKATRADLDRALDAAKRSFEVWRKVAPYDRAKVLRRAADLMRERVEEIAAQLTWEEGKSLAESRLEVLVSADLFDWQAEEARRAYGRQDKGKCPIPS